MGIRTARARAVVVGSAVVAVALALAGCIPTPTPTTTVTVRPTPSSTPTGPPTIDLTGTAGDNQRYFDSVNKALIAKGGDLGGRSFIDNLVSAGYPKSAMEVTPDRTSVDLQADNIEFSILLNGTCLIGEYGNVGYASTTGAPFSTGKCLAGITRTIDW